MRLLFVSHSFSPVDRPLANVGGMQRIATEIHKELARRDDVKLSSLLLRTEWQKIHLHMVPFMIRLLWQIPRTVARNQIDTVLFSSMVTGALAPLLRGQMGAACPRLAAIPVGRDVTLPFAPYQHLIPRVFRALDVVLPISHATGEVCQARGLDSRKICVIPCGVDTTRFAPVEGREARRKLLDALPPRIRPKLLLCSVGRHQERKGFHWFVSQVMPLLPEGVHYLLAGTGPMTEVIQAAVVEHGLEGRVHLLGKISEEMLRTLYQGTDLFVMPNIPVPGDIEGFGVVMLEAGINGLPVVAARLEGIQDVVTEGQNGHLIESGDAEGFARVILSYYHAPEEKLCRASKLATTHVTSTFSWDAVVGRYLEVLKTGTPAANC